MKQLQIKKIYIYKKTIVRTRGKSDLKKLEMMNFEQLKNKKKEKDKKERMKAT